MTIKELKTLKDIIERMPHGVPIEVYEFYKELKAEAVKWVKHLREIKEPFGTNILTGLNKKQKEEVNYVASLSLMYFFNLTEEDLEEEK